MRIRPSDRQWERLPCPNPNAEDTYIAAQEAGYASPAERERLEYVLTQLPDIEVKCLVLSTRGATQADTASELGISQATVWYRLRRVKRKLEWLRGPGSWFHSTQIYDTVLQCGLSRPDAEIAAQYWSTTSLQMGTYKSQSVWRSIQRSRRALWSAAWDGRPVARFALGLDELGVWGRELLRPR